MLHSASTGANRPVRYGLSVRLLYRLRGVALVCAILSGSFGLAHLPPVGAQTTPSGPSNPAAPCSGISVTAPATAALGSVVSVSVTADCPSASSAAVAYWMLAPGATGWQNMTAWTGLSWNWDTVGLAPGKYLISAWLTDGTPLTPQAQAETSVVLNAIPPTAPCTGATLSTDNSNPAVGQIVTLTATSSCAGAAAYAYWVTTPGATLWRNVTSWTGASWNWDTSTTPPGSYEFSVWVTDGPLTSPQAVAAITVNVGGSTGTFEPCTGAALTASAVTLPATGGPVVLDTSATCPGSPPPSYAYWLQSPNSGWVNVTAWTGSTWTWNASGVAPGVYRLSAWVTNGQQTFPQAEGTVQVTVEDAAGSGPCSAVSLAAAASPVAAGQPVSLSATAICPGTALPLFAYWLESPTTGSWQNVTAWTNGSWTWDTTGVTPGLYDLEVWTTDGAPNSAQATAILQVSITSAPAPAAPCTSVSSSTANSGGVSGDPLPVTSVASCPASAEPVFAYWYEEVPAGGAGSNWVLAQNWTTSASYAFSTTGWTPGAYVIVVWASDVPGSVQATTTLSYTVTAPPPQSLQNPTSNMPPTFDGTCYATGYSSLSCQEAEIADLNLARAAEGLGPLALPSGFYTMPTAQQLFILADEERVSRGLPAIPGLTQATDSNALAGATANTDPAPGTIPGVFAYTGNWAEDYGPIGGTFDWMYNDGYGSGNIDCTSPTAAGCWGHRDGILLDTSSGGFSAPAGYTWVAGAGCAPSAGWAFLDSCDLEYALLPTSAPTYVFTWAQAQQLGA